MTSPEDFIAEIRREAEAGRKIQAIKMVRHLTGLGLKESKELVENDLDSLNAENYQEVRPIPESKGCITTSAVILSAVIGLRYLIGI